MSGNKTKLLITGGLGNLGSWVTDYLSVNKAIEIYILARNERRFNVPEGVKILFCDITDRENLQKLFSTIEFDYIVHLASINETFIDNYAREAVLVNSFGTRNLLGAISGKPVKRFLYISTFHVYGKSGGEIGEEDTPMPLSDYGITHLFAEQYIEMFARTNKVPYTILRLSNSYGCPLDIATSKWYLLFNDLCRQAMVLGQIEMKTNGNARRDFIAMKDVCLVIEKILFRHNLPDGIYNLGSGQSNSLLEIASMIRDAYREVFNKDLNIITNKNDQTDYPPSLVFTINKLIAAVPFEPGNYFKEEAKKIFKLLS